MSAGPAGGGRPERLYRGPGAEATRVLRGGRDRERDPPQPGPSFPPRVPLSPRLIPREAAHSAASPPPSPPPPPRAGPAALGAVAGPGARGRAAAGSGERESRGASPSPHGAGRWSRPRGVAAGVGPGFPGPPWTATGGARVPGPERWSRGRAGAGVAASAAASPGSAAQCRVQGAVKPGTERKKEQERRGGKDSKEGVLEGKGEGCSPYMGKYGLIS